MAKKFDIIVHDLDLDGTMHIHKENGVMAESAKALIALYKASDQQIEIEREYEDFESRNYGKSQPLNTQGVQLGGDSRVGGAGTFMKVDPNLPQIPQQNVDQIAVKPQPVLHLKKEEPPRYFEIGGIKCKMENGKMYQKQWMRLSDSEASEFRIVSDKNNKICPIKDKHIEVMKWVMIEDKSENTSNTTNNNLELLNG